MTLIFSCASADGIRIMLAASHHNLCLLFGITITEGSDGVSIVHNKISDYNLCYNYSRVSSCRGVMGQSVPVCERRNICSGTFAFQTFS